MLFVKLFAGLALMTAWFSDQQPVQTAKDLYHTRWKLVNVREGNKIFTPEGRGAFLQLHPEKSSAGGNGGCNSFGSTVKVEGRAIHFSEIFSTKMYCDGVQGTEDAYFHELGEVNRYDITGDTLRLYRDQDQRLEFKAEP